MQGEAIAAVATPRGKGGIAVLRVSGKGVVETVSTILSSRESLISAPARTMVLGWITDSKTGERVDQVLAAAFRAPASYTGEDMVEIYGHGGKYVSSCILDVLLHAGCRLARPGEFTHRAFVNGKMDLMQVEAVSDIVDAQTAEQRRLAVFAMEGGGGGFFAAIREEIEEWLMAAQAAIEFPEEERNFEWDSFNYEWNGVVERIRSALGSFEQCRRIREGLLVPIVGRPNAGKSSLFNWFCRSERVIVDSQPGTTRDAVEEELEIKGMCVRLVDTAGIRTTSERVEKAGIQKTRELLEKADLVIWVHDCSEVTEALEKEWLSHFEKKQTIHVFNKSDLRGVDQVLCVSCKNGMGLEKLRSEIEAAVSEKGFVGGIPISVLERDCLAGALTVAGEIQVALEGGERSEEKIAEDLKECLARLAPLAGRSANGELMDRIFSRFCIGK